MHPDPHPARASRRHLRFPWSLTLLLAACGAEAAAGSCCDADAAEAAAAAKVAAAPVVASPADGQDGARDRVRIPDVTLLDQRGRPVRLLGDLIAGKRVAIDFVFTTCTTVCPTLQSVFQGVQEQLGDRLGDDVVLLSISVDPAHDTPRRMAAFAADFGARDGWYFLTGDPTAVTSVLKAFGVWTRKKEEHTALFVLGNEPTGKWMYQSGFTSPSAVVERLVGL
ncbi:MAG: SCO family protein [Planctomycetota bacterium]